MNNDKNPKKITKENRNLTNLILGRKGGNTTVKIIDELLIKPYNVNQLSETLNLDYKTIRHHIKIIYQHKYIEKEDLGYCVLYYPSHKLINSLIEYYHIKEKLNK